MRSEFNVLVSDLVGALGRFRAIEAEGRIELDLDHARTTDRPVRVEARVDATTDGVVVRGTASADIALTCTRCLDEWVESRTAQITQVFGFTESDDVEPISADGEIDLEPVVHDELAVSIPLVPRCRTDCAGLCPTCGTDLNMGTCPGHTDGLDSPFAALAGLVNAGLVTSDEAEPDEDDSEGGDQAADPVGNKRGGQTP